MDRFERQRRNLIAVSVSLCVYYYLGFEVNSLNFLGNSVTIEKPGNVEMGLWAIWAYFLVRYLQFYKVSDRTEFSSVYQRVFDNLLVENILKSFSESNELDDFMMKFPGKDISFDKVDVDITSLKKSQVDACIRGVVDLTDGYKTVEEKFPQTNYSVSGYPIVSSRLRAFIYLMLRTPTFTEYHLPVVIALSPLIVKYALI